ncbi:VOC family protein [Roseicyclus elongatus]|uniref:VOC family protein n=1 Tax=Roseicyclus elongatus TaxID=159346 RepID=UPI0012EBD44C|nr:VOC family protein [Roseibacterium elongatum]
MPVNRVTMITLGVHDIGRSRGFYGALGWTEARAMDGVVFYQMDGMLLSLFRLGPLAADQGRPGAELGAGAMTLAQNFRDTAAVDAAFARALDAGATVLKAPAKTLWGGYSGYFADPDGHVWELAYNPHWPLDEAGRTAIPE